MPALSKLFVACLGLSFAACLPLGASAHAQGMTITTMPGYTVNLSLIEDDNGHLAQYLGRLQGSVSVDATQHVTSLSGTITSLDRDDGKNFPVSSSEVRDGMLVITTADGAVYEVYALGSNMVGRMRKVKG